MNIRINGNELKKLLLATSKLKSREVLTCLHIERVGDFVQFATTDGGALVTMTRPLSTYDDDLPEGFSLTFKLADIKINDKYIYNLIEENGQLFFVGYDIKAAVVPFPGTFPNYKSITKGFEDLPVAKDFTMFSEKNIKLLFKVFDIGFNFEPKTSGKYNPHFWERQIGDSVWVVVLMPMRQ